MSAGDWQGGAAPGMVAGAGATALESTVHYPVTAAFDAPLDVARWRVVGNYILGIPHLVLLYILLVAAQFVVLVAWFVVLFTGRMPEGMGTFVSGVHRYQWRVITYVFFLRESYPSFAVPSGYPDPGDDAARLTVTPPIGYSRLAVLLRAVLIIPLAVAGFFYYIGLYAALVVAFFAVLFTGRWPEGLRRFVLGIGFWVVRVNAWYALLTDKYPPFAIG